ncbi:hypothetical protein [Actinoplanes teichomyceticus]|uniref:Uncharacterized protein n=1 Tax=Actinoplanes teichomyceticus TaxID=1867 RepID=A0A561VGI2_ACTTI|nr:hypothetical protein [Actinoplanes teichomyceticus]TWG10708.1 hypothetical protein FHX34_107204 [Actinoplanes teichomyceticus]GIF15474.1 hypothetical protein Ate01nite_55060 [Actinoplanes teichomyceticus]
MSESEPHPVLSGWHTQFREDPDGVDPLLRARIAWAVTTGRLSSGSYIQAADRALTAAREQTKSLPIIEIEVACNDPQLLPAQWLQRQSDADIAVCYLDEIARPRPLPDIDLVEVTITANYCGTWADVTARAWAAPDWLSSHQRHYYDLLRVDRMTPAQALGRLRRMPGRSVRVRPGRRRPAHRRRILRCPQPHPALLHWLSAALADPDADRQLLSSLRWATSVTGCLTRDAYDEAARRAVTAARAAGATGWLLQAASARTDLLSPHRLPMAAIFAAVSGGAGLPHIDQVIISRSDSDEAAGVAWAAPVGVRWRDVAQYEAYRAAGLSMAEAYRRLKRTSQAS